MSVRRRVLRVEENSQGLKQRDRCGCVATCKHVKIWSWRGTLIAPVAQPIMVLESALTVGAPPPQTSRSGGQHLKFRNYNKSHDNSAT